MPRTAREQSKSGIYHVMIRGANKQEIFHDDSDRIRFLEILGKCKGKTRIQIYGWCLMNNHVHLLIKEGKGGLATAMKRIGVSFVGYYHKKYETTGHLFQDRFRSESVENEHYLLTVIRYIHQNPVKAGFVKDCLEWKWSSYRAYLGKETDFGNLLDDETILESFGTCRDVALKGFEEFHGRENQDECLDIEVRKLKEKEARLEIEKVLAGKSVARVKSLPKEERDEMIRILKGIKGLNQRQLARILGISQALISKA
ncbi:transposase [Alkalibacter rhizosphaerae]|uniref:Transposase n=1 Tax=Alkalibacter rhizosphaerae TaxID=2815577 RepID=A0A974XG33_9FIRM|nr:transposase [Alkalibacter rhizosphaerae]QSX09222.1 transposase [Alkalibacter rhizosphaerae]